MRQNWQIKWGILLLTLCVGIGSGCLLLIARNQQKARENDAFAKMQAYSEERMELDSQMSALQKQLQDLEFTVQGTLILAFDQCAPNVYDIVYSQLTEFGMAGSVIFRDTLPSDVGAITKEQWLQMQNDGWCAVLASGDELLDTLGQAGYTDRLCDYAARMRDAFADLGLAQPTAYSFAEGEYSEENRNALCEMGFSAFSAPDVQTTRPTKDCILVQEFYISGSPDAPLLQPAVDAIKNKAEALVIKTRYVHEIEDRSLDIDLTKFRAGMLNSLSGYQNAKTIHVTPLQKAAQIYPAECEELVAFEGQKKDLQAQMDAVSEQLQALWDKYRS